MKNGIKFNFCDTNSLTNNQIKELVCIQKDMWSYWLWEYIKCNSCNKIHSKADIFWYLWNEFKYQPVTKLENIFLSDSIKCTNCFSTDTEFIYDIDKNIEIFINRYKKQSYLVLSKNNSWEVIWFCDWYISSLEDIYKSDLSIHYGMENLWKIFDLVQDKLPLDNLSKLLYFSSLWTYQEYINYNYLYEMLRSFFNSMSNIWFIKWITELDKNNSLYKIYKIMWSISIWVENILNKNTQENYDSDICVFNDPINDFKSKYDIPFRELIKKYKIK